ncbi:MAG TPA: hypothetical protein VGD22_14115, partial [Sphingobacteriaceae bacterium]
IYKIRRTVLEGQKIDVKELRSLGKLVREEASPANITKIKKTLKSVDSLLDIKDRYEKYVEAYKIYKLNPDQKKTHEFEKDKQLKPFLIDSNCPDSVIKAMCLIQLDEELLKGDITDLGGKALELFTKDENLMNLVLTIRPLNQTAVSHNAIKVGTALLKKEESIKVVIERELASKMNVPSQSDVIDAMAIYLANRVKLETALTFMEVLKKTIRKDSLLLSLFPQTEKVLTSYSTYEVPNFGSAWRHAFAEDFVAMPQKFGETEMNSYLKTRFGTINANVAFLQQAVNFAVKSRENTNFIDVIEFLKFQYDERKDTSAFSNFVRVVSMVNNEFYSLNKQNYWISYTEFMRMDTEELDVMITMLQSKYPWFYKNIRINRDSTDGKRNISEFKSWFSGIMYVVNQYQLAQAQANVPITAFTASDYWKFTSNLFQKVIVEGKENAALARLIPKQAEEFYKVLTPLSSLYTAIDEKNYPHAFEEVINLITLLQDNGYINKQYFNSFFVNKSDTKFNHAIEPVRNITVSILTANTRAKELKSDVDAIKSEMVRLGEISPADANITRLTRECEELENEAIRILNKIPDLRQTLITKLEDYKTSKSKKLNGSFCKPDLKFLDAFIARQEEYAALYGGTSLKKFSNVVNFVNDVAKTKESKDLSRVIASYASPPQSYRLKRASRSSWDMNAYVGMVAGYEIIRAKNDVSGSSKPAYGLSAPIGISYSWTSASKLATARSLSSFQKGDGSLEYLTGRTWTVSVSIIDIGAAVRYRLGSGSEKGLPQNVTFAQVLSPGVSLRRSIRNTPLCYFGGWQYLPQLRNFADAKSVRDYSGAHQLNFGVAFDLPLFNFSNGSR